VNAEGWYIDDVQMPVIIAVNENESGDIFRALIVTPNPFRTHTDIRWQITANRYQITDDGKKTTTLGIYDISGRLVKSFSLSDIGNRLSVTWTGVDDTGRRVASGVYIVQLDLNGEKQTEKVLLLK
jgi:hypothetical protein